MAWHIVEDEFGHDQLRWNDDVMAYVTGEDEGQTTAAYRALVRNNNAAEILRELLTAIDMADGEEMSDVPTHIFLGGRLDRRDRAMRAARLFIAGEVPS
jgi:hypothetical protein